MAKTRRRQQTPVEVENHISHQSTQTDNGTETHPCGSTTINNGHETANVDDNDSSDNKPNDQEHPSNSNSKLKTFAEFYAVEILTKINFKNINFINTNTFVKPNNDQGPMKNKNSNKPNSV